MTNLEGTGATVDQGSLRQFITNANLGTGPNAMRFVPTVATNGIDVGDTWWSLSPTVSLPTVSDPNTTIDGTAFDAADGVTQLDTNLSGPELELNGVGVGGNGLETIASSTTIRDLVVNRFTTGIAVLGGTGSVIAGNYLGPDARAVVGQVGNTDEGIRVFGATNTVIGGSVPADRNVISGNRLRGVWIDDFTDGAPAISSGTQVIGNYLGTNAAGIGDLPYDNTPSYQQVGVAVWDGPNNVIGTATDGNVVSGNAWYGVYIWGPNASGNTIQGNIVGLDFLGVGVIPNGFDTPPRAGIFISNAPGNLIGGTAAGEGNIVAGNADAGITVSAAGAIDNTILGNTVYGNGALGIDLGGDGVTANDTDDLDTGPNDLLNFPVITLAAESAGTVNVDVDVDLPAGSYRIEFFDNTAADLSGYGEGETLVASYNLVGHPGGAASFSTSFAGVVGDIITATATEGITAPFGATSEFSAAFTVVPINYAPTDITLTPSDVDENVPVGTTVGTLTTTDANAGDTHTYALVAGAGDTHNGLFTIVGDEVRTNAALDFESLSSPLSIRVETTDSGTPNLSYQEALSIVLNDLNEAPVLAAIGNQTVDELVELTFTASATDEDLPGDTLTFSLSGAPAGASIDPVTGVFTWTPTEAQGPGVYTFDVVVTDDGTPALSCRIRRRSR